MYADPISVADFESWCDKMAQISSMSMADEMPDHETVRMNGDSIRAHIVDTSAMFEPCYFKDAVNERAQQSKVAMSAGATHTDDHGSELFEELESSISDATAALSAVTATGRNGISAEVLSKIWRIPIEQAEHTLGMTTQLNKQDADSSLSRNFGTTDCMLRY